MVMEIAGVAHAWRTGPSRILMDSGSADMNFRGNNPCFSSLLFALAVAARSSVATESLYVYSGGTIPLMHHTPNSSLIQAIATADESPLPVHAVQSRRVVACFSELGKFFRAFCRHHTAIATV